MGHYTDKIPEEDKELIIEALQRLYKQRTDVVNTVNDAKIDLTIENWALDKKKIKEILLLLGTSPKSVY